MLYKATDRTTNRLVSLIIKCVPPSRKFSISNLILTVALINLEMAEFEETFIHRLSIVRAQTMLRRNRGTMLAYFSPGGEQVRSEARILNLMGYEHLSRLDSLLLITVSNSRDMNMIQKFAEMITFSTGRHSYSRSSIDSIQLLHYKSLDNGYILTDAAIPKHALSCLDSSEIVIFYTQQEPQTAVEDIDRTILHCIVP